MASSSLALAHLSTWPQVGILLPHLLALNGVLEQAMLSPAWPAAVPGRTHAVQHLKQAHSVPVSIVPSLPPLLRLSCCKLCGLGAKMVLTWLVWGSQRSSCRSTARWQTSGVWACSCTSSSRACSPSGTRCRTCPCSRSSPPACPDLYCRPDRRMGCQRWQMHADACVEPLLLQQLLPHGGSQPYCGLGTLPAHQLAALDDG